MTQLNLFEPEKPEKKPNTLEYERKTLVEFSFMKRNYVGYYHVGEPGISEVKGVKSLRLFKSWFRLMKNKKRLLYGVVRFVGTGETWLWQPSTGKRFRTERGDWQLALSAKE